MDHTLQIEPVAYYRGPFGSKFGIPRQSSLADVRGRIVFTEAYRNREALRGLEGFGRIWLIWGFSANKPAKGEWQPTVRPPRLGGNTAMGVWATRSPYRPNPLGLSCVEVEQIDGLEIVIKGADLMDGTPIYDIKPYVPYADAFPDAAGGFAQEAPKPLLEVEIPEHLPFTEAQRSILRQILSLDPRPAYQDSPEKEYAMPFEGADVRFRVQDGKVIVTDYRP
ncbi:MAG: tRNA (N6-threonylcarbamoyladenosine(37)-N6)-methyltransferase TrmO [Bacteroidales bacterium]|nr:tRNA (N6-threonylcarbamoyladenosine(37)-N6)-methyltransferase TrmO [Bacteroidales bacterium]MBR5063222.1 tRNA (N6-threonylcarbamoyladenosine(37)-N6)-methyltransferase TrmO [Bacteroidales bacterium]MCR4569652.1 tRNA (N6-threonylcarbamoyladenosine(37)-N6)-methyltransferase TrmO [Bacteroidales bacterium]